MCTSTCSLQINIQIDFQSVKVCTFSSLSFPLGMGHIASGLNDEVDAGTDEALVIVCVANPAESDRTEIQVTWFSLV